VAKEKALWVCENCGDKHAKWSGQCHLCKEWNTIKEEILAITTPRFITENKTPSKPMRVSEVPKCDMPRILTKNQEFDRLLGGGLVPGSLSLVGGDPGIGKSTLLLQISQALAIQNLTVLYICGEESISQTSLRAKRLNVDNPNLFLLSETNFNCIKPHIDTLNPDIIIVDSIQILYKEEISSAPGSITQVRENAMEFMHLAKGRGIAIFLIGHVTKSGEIAGPKILEHLVDTVLYFEGDRHLNFRIMRVVKNRFGTTDEIAVFQMLARGLREVTNPSQLFLEERTKEVSGSVIISTIEGTRPILVEIQALLTDTVFATPSRRCTGLDKNRVSLLIAVLEKYMGYPLYRSDAFLSVAGGLKILEPAVDLGVMIAIASSFSNKPVDPNTIVIGEVGLGGEVRAVPRIVPRLKEAFTMGFKRAVIPKRNMRGLAGEIPDGLQIVGVKKIQEAINTVIQN
jgi:DNA repair protein RadA/Sms